MVTELLSILIVALIVQQAVEAIKKAIKIKKGYSLFNIINIKVLISIIISITLCVTSEIGLLALLGIEALPILDYILTGLIVSGGANGIRELQKQIQSSKINQEQEVTTDGEQTNKRF